MGLLNLLRPRVPVGAILAMAVPLAVCAGAAVVVAVEVVRTAKPLRKSIKAGIAIKAMTDERAAQLEELIATIGADMGLVAGKARKWAAKVKPDVAADAPANDPSAPEVAEQATPALDRLAALREARLNGASADDGTDHATRRTQEQPS